VFVGCARKHEQSKKVVTNELFSEIGFFREERVIYDIRKSLENLGHGKSLKKLGKIRKSWSMTKKKVVRNFGR